MNRVIGALSLVVLMGLPALGQQDAQKTVTKKTVKGPAMELTPEDHDFGKVKQNQTLVKEFEIENIGTENLEIGRISTSCGCTAALTSDKVVKPGESTTLKVTLETRKYKGTIQRSVSISFINPKRVKTVKVKAFVLESADDSTKSKSGDPSG
jgi:hypothetical protein